jgi:hypothetical protein
VPVSTYWQVHHGKIPRSQRLDREAPRLTGEIAHYQTLIKRLTVDVSHLDAAIKILAPDFDLRTIRSKEYRKRASILLEVMP